MISLKQIPASFKYSCFRQIARKFNKLNATSNRILTL